MENVNGIHIQNDNNLSVTEITTDAVGDVVNNVEEKIFLNFKSKVQN